MKHFFLLHLEKKRPKAAIFPAKIIQKVLYKIEKQKNIQNLPESYHFSLGSVVPKKASHNKKCYTQLEKAVSPILYWFIS